MKLDYMQCWNGAMKLLSDNKEAILAIAGVFIFLPTLLTAQFVGQPELTGAEEADAMIAAYSEYFSANRWAIVTSNLLIIFGGLALYFTVAPSQKGTVADNLGKAAKIYILFIIAYFLTGMATLLGFFALILPGFYIAVRLALVPIIIADQEERNPIEALKRSWNVTKGSGLSILLLVLMVALIGIVTMGVISLIVGIITGLATGGEGWLLIENLVAALTGTAFQIVLTVLIASIYMQLTGKATDVEEIFS